MCEVRAANSRIPLGAKRLAAGLRRNFGAGFTFVEALIVTALLAVTMAVFLAGLFAVNANITVTRNTIASEVALRRMEQLRATSFSSLPSSGPFTDPSLLKLPSATATLTVQDYLGTSSMKQVLINIAWRDGRATRTYRLDSVFTEGGTRAP